MEMSQREKEHEVVGITKKRWIDIKEKCMIQEELAQIDPMHVFFLM